MRRLAAPCLVIALAMAPGALAAQASRADSAAVLLDAVRALESRGERSAARELRRYLLERFPGTPAADSAAAQPARTLDERGRGRLELVAWSAVYGAWLGIAVPAMLSADDPTPYGLGLLTGGPLGYLLSNTYARGSGITPGQARAMTFGFLFGTWQGLALQQELNIGDHQQTQCFGPPPQGCFTFEEESGTAPFAMMVAGGLTGMLVGHLAGRAWNPSGGRVSYVDHSAIWGTYFGAIIQAIASPDDGDGVLTAMVVGGDVGIVLGAALAPPGVTQARVWLTSAFGVAGTAAGFGLILLTQTDDQSAAFAMLGTGTAAGLALGWQLTSDVDQRYAGREPPPPNAALLDFADGRLRVQPPAPGLTAVRVAPGPRGDIYRPAVAVPLVRVRF